MAVSSIEETSALVVIDMQKGLVPDGPSSPLRPVLANARELVDAFKEQSLPVVLVTVDGQAPGRVDRTPGGAPRTEDFATLVDDLDENSADVRIVKERWSAFAATGLQDELTDRGVTQVVLAGVATSMGVESTARAAHEQGYDVVLAIDAMADADSDRHEHTVTSTFPMLGESGTTAEIIALLPAAAPQ